MEENVKKIAELFEQKLQEQYIEGVKAGYLAGARGIVTGVMTKTWNTPAELLDTMKQAIDRLYEKYGLGRIDWTKSFEDQLEDIDNN